MTNLDVVLLLADLLLGLGFDCLSLAYCVRLDLIVCFYLCFYSGIMISDPVCCGYTVFLLILVTLCICFVCLV